MDGCVETGKATAQLNQLNYSSVSFCLSIKHELVRKAEMEILPNTPNLSVMHTIAVNTMH